MAKADERKKEAYLLAMSSISFTLNIATRFKILRLVLNIIRMGKHTPFLQSTFITKRNNFFNF